jgi:hypothetical protein
MINSQIFPLIVIAMGSSIVTIIGALLWGHEMYVDKKHHYITKDKNETI